MVRGTKSTQAHSKTQANTFGLLLKTIYLHVFVFVRGVKDFSQRILQHVLIRQDSIYLSQWGIVVSLQRFRYLSNFQNAQPTKLHQAAFPLPLIFTTSCEKTRAT